MALRGIHRKAQKAIGAALEPNETVLIVCDGEYGAIVATNRRIFICKWGITTGAMFGSQLSSWDLRNVAGIESRKGMTTSSVVIQTPGTVPVTKFGRMDNGAGSVWEAPNALFLKDEQGRLVAKLRELVADAHQAGTPATAATPLTDPSDQIRSLALLRDEGLLTEDEFAAKKRQILGL